MTALFDTYRARVAVALVATTIVVAALCVRGATHIEAPTIGLATTEDGELHDQRTANTEPPPVDTNTATITEVIPGPGCGVLIGATQIRYGDAFGVAIPCIEFFEGDVLRFEVGETQTILVDDRDRVIAIRTRRGTRRLDGGFESVKMPATAVGHVGWSSDSHMSYETFDGWQPHWSWRP